MVEAEQYFLFVPNALDTTFTYARTLLGNEAMFQLESNMNLFCLFRYIPINNHSDPQKFLKIEKRIILLYDFVSDILKHKENRVKLQFAFCTVSFIHES